jgi:hypothetical protein
MVSSECPTIDYRCKTSAAVSELRKRRAQIAAKLEAAEAKWLEANEQLERLAA